MAVFTNHLQITRGRQSSHFKLLELRVFAGWVIFCTLFTKVVSVLQRIRGCDEVAEGLG